jgi:hypothetical protein
MIRSVALTVSLFVAAPAVAQVQHPQTHPQGRPHDPSGHMPMDPAQHAAMHALLHGEWKGTSSSAEGVSGKLALAVASDKHGNVTLKMKADQPIRVGAASNFAIDGNKLQWTQDVSGKPCKTSALLSAATPHAPETMTGSMACEHGEIAFTLQKTKG